MPLWILQVKERISRVDARNRVAQGRCGGFNKSHRGCYAERKRDYTTRT